MTNEPCVTSMNILVVVNWDAASPWGRYVTVDNNGKIMLHENEPTEDGGSWVSDGQFELIGSIEPVCAERPVISVVQTIDDSEPCDL